MATSKLDKLVSACIDASRRLADSCEADAILLFVEKPLPWTKIKPTKSQCKTLVAATSDQILESADKYGLPTVKIDRTELSIQDRLTQAVLESVADELVPSGSTIVCVYSSFDAEHLDSISVLKLTERLGRLTARDLQKLETKVPLDTLKIVVDLAVDIGREGREGKPVGTMFVVGDHRTVLEDSRPAGFDPFKGYNRKDRNLADARVREGLKEIAQLDGAFVISSDGTVEGGCRIIDTAPADITMTKGLGTRHYTAAKISKNTKAISVVVSESSGTVRLYQNGAVVLRIEPFRRAMKWTDFSADGQSGGDES